MSTTATGGVARALEAVAGVEGWMSDAQAARLHARARAVRPGGRVVEIGSYRGRSIIILALAAPRSADIVAIDPHAGNDRGPRQLEGTRAEGDADHAAFLANLERAGVRDRVRHVRLPSQAALEAVSGRIDLLYVDGAHRYGPARDDLARWGARVLPGGALLVHDAFSSVGVTLAIARVLAPSAGFAYRGRTGSLAEYERVAAMPLRRRLRNAARQARELPWFGRNLVVKAALVARAVPVARALGHRDGPWPY